MVVRSWMFWKISSFNMVVKLLSSCVDNIFHWLHRCKMLNISKDITLQYGCKAIIILSITILRGLECFKRYHLQYGCMVIIIIIIWPLFRPIFWATFGSLEFLFYLIFLFRKPFFPFYKGLIYGPFFLGFSFSIFTSNFQNP